MYVQVAGFRSPLALLLTAAALVWGACGGEDENVVVAMAAPDDEMPMAGGASDEPTDGCDRVEIDGEFVIEHEKDFTARYRMGEPYTRTVMLFGGEATEQENSFNDTYIFGLDKVDAQMLAEKYLDFYLCSSPGGQEASMYIVPYTLVAATCDVHDRIVAALRTYNLNVASGGDRTSLRFDGAPLELVSVTADANGDDYTDQVEGEDFHLVTDVEQLTGESVLEFGSTN